MPRFRQTRIGRIGIAERSEAVSRLYLPGEAVPNHASEMDEDAFSPLLREAFAQLEAYLEGKLRRFDLPLGAEGTPFPTARRRATRRSPRRWVM